MAAQVQLAPGNGVWLKPSTTSVTGNEGALVSLLNSRAIRHVFLWTVGYTSTNFSTFTPFIRQCHANGMTVHAVCATKTTVTSDGVMSPMLLSNALQQVTFYNAANPTACLDGVQIDIEGVSGASLVELVSSVSVPETLVFSAAIQPNEFYTSVESSYNSLLQNTDLDLLIPMLYSMDGIYYSGGEAKFAFTLQKLRSKTASILALLPAGGKMMAGISAFDREYPISKTTLAIDRDYLNSIGASDGWSLPAFSTYSASTKSVPNLVAAGKSFVKAAYGTNSGVSIYRFDYDTNRWMDVIEMTPLGVRESIAQAAYGAAGNTNFIGSCVWLHHTVFDQYSGRQEGLTPDDATYPQPRVALEILSITPAQVRLRVTLTNAVPSEHLLGGQASAGVHLRLEGASFISAKPGAFHEAQAFDQFGGVSSNIEGTQILELHRCFFENSVSPCAASGEILISPSASFLIKYRAWITDKDSSCSDRGLAEPYVARDPDDLHYDDPSKRLTHATWSTNIVVVPPPQSESAVLADDPVVYLCFDETGVETRPNPFTVENLGSLGAAGMGSASMTNSIFTNSIIGPAQGVFGGSTSRALRFPGSDTNRIVMPQRAEWNTARPFTVELWVKGGTKFSCPASATDLSRGWLFYQGNASQSDGNGWWFRVYKSGSRVNAQADMTVNPDAWYHIVGVFDGTNASLYVNGASVATTALGGAYVPNTSAAYPFSIGARSDGGDYAFGGLIDEPAFYTNALSASEVAAHFATAATNSAGYSRHVLSHNPAGYWPFDDAMKPPTAQNKGAGGSELAGAYIHYSTTAPDLDAPGFPGFTGSNRVLQVFGTNGQVILPALNLATNAATFECWLKRDGSQQTSAGLIMHRNGSDAASAAGLCFNSGNNTLGYQWNGAADTYNWNSGLTPPDGRWAFTALVVMPTQAVIYLCDGTCWKSATNIASHGFQAFAGLTRIGSDGGIGRWFRGSVDSVAIYRQALSETRLRAHALAGFGNTNQPLFTVLPASQTLQDGDALVLCASAVGAPTISYQWQKDGVNIPNATDTSLAITGVDYTDAGQYRLSATNTFGGAITPAVTLVVMPPSSVTNLTYRTSGTQSAWEIELIWPAGTLYSAEDLAGPWTIVDGAVLPYCKVPITPAPSRKFFRVE